MKVYAKHERIQAFLKEHPLKNVEIVDDPKQANYWITGRFTAQDYHRNLQGIIIPWTGHNGIDLDAMRKYNLQLYVTPTRSKYVAEKAVSLTLALLGNTINYHIGLQEGSWSARNSEHRVPWVSIQGLSIGLFGYGRIGTKIHQMLKGFDCEFYTIDRGKEYEGINTVKNLTNLVQMTDVIIISAPLNSETEGIFDKQLFSRMKNKYLINVGRGKICDEKELYQALIDNKLKGYAADVWFNYPKGKENAYPSVYPFHELEQVVLSNHSGGYTIHTNEEVNRDLLQTLSNIVNGNDTNSLDVNTLL